jgi:filamentous hemagglutinin family protein
MRGFALTMGCSAIALGIAMPAVAQIEADNTLGSERSQVPPPAQTVLIEGGAVRGINLFHSFREFNVGEGQGVYFRSPNAGIENILARVTGNFPSNILGQLGTASLSDPTVGAPNVNLFLINPNGIVFGPNATLRMEGSFVATSASAIEFDSQGSFSATNPSSGLPLLTVNPSAYLFSQGQLGPISSSGGTNLRVPRGQSLTLLGGDVNLAGGRLTARGGRIELGSVAGTGRVGIGLSGDLQFESGVARGSVELSTGVKLDVQSNGGGAIGITAQTIRIVENSQVLAGINPFDGDEESRVGNVQLNATGTILIEGGTGGGPEDKTQISNNVVFGATGNAGDIVLIAENLQVTSGARIISLALGDGKAGNIEMDVRDRILLQDSIAGAPNLGILNPSEAGNMTIETGILEILGGAQLNGSTFGKGDAGNIDITARDRIVIDGTNLDNGRSSGIFINNNGTLSSLVESGAAGKVSIRAPQLTLSNGAVIDATTINRESGGDITLNLQQLNLLGGAQILTTSQSRGRAGTIFLTATEGVRISGIDPNYSDRVARHGDRVTPISPNSGIYVRATGSGTAGDISINTPFLRLDQQGRINAESKTGGGGNLVLTIPDLLLLRNGSQISATAGSSNPQAPGDGGNININGGFVLAVLQENSDITANAQRGRGGNVKINAQGIFGIRVQPKLTQWSDITASSESGPTGNIEVAAPDADPSRGLLLLPVGLTDTSNRIDYQCDPRTAVSRSTFVILGRGGLPAGPSDRVNPPTLGRLAVLPGASLQSQTPQNSQEGNFSQGPDPKALSPAESAPVEMQAWQRSTTGEVTLVAGLEPRALQPWTCQRQEQAQQR